MFIKFSESRANYKKGQVFPLLIAVIAVLIIMAMVTVNLGKLAIFKTDVSNAADAGALAGASILSGALLGFGLASDQECGYAVITVARSLEILVIGRDDIKIPSFTRTTGGQQNNQADLTQFPQDLIAMLKLFIQDLIAYYTHYIQVVNDGKLAWANAKQTALKFAFQNAGIDEPPLKKFKDYSGSYDDYLTSVSQGANQSGFSRFMSNTSGFWNGLPKIQANMDSLPIEITSGYGWTQEKDETFSDSYPGDNNYKIKDNYVEVKVKGSMLYPIDILTFLEYFGSDVCNFLVLMATLGAMFKYYTQDKDIKQMKNGSWVGQILAVIFSIVLGVVAGAAFWGVLKNLPCGFTFKDEARSTTNNPLLVQVTRHKKDSNLGMWNFQYGDVVAKSAAHAFQQAPDPSDTDGVVYSDKDITIKPVIMEAMKDLGKFLGEVDWLSIVGSFLDPSSLLNQIRGDLCMGVLVFGATSFPLAIMDPAIMLSFFLTYLIYDPLCSSDGINSMMDGQVNFFDFKGSSDGKWFVSGLHLFETELVKGFLQ